jgi:hypothetical protein
MWLRNCKNRRIMTLCMGWRNQLHPIPWGTLNQNQWIGIETLAAAAGWNATTPGTLAAVSIEFHAVAGSKWLNNPNNHPTPTNEIISFTTIQQNPRPLPGSQPPNWDVARRGSRNTATSSRRWSTPTARCRSPQCERRRSPVSCQGNFTESCLSFTLVWRLSGGVMMCKNTCHLDHDPKWGLKLDGITCKPEGWLKLDRVL